LKHRESEIAETLKKQSESSAFSANSAFQNPIDTTTHRDHNGEWLGQETGHNGQETDHNTS
jgi:hypothetical protein